MRFVYPEFFLLIPALAALAWLWRGLQIQRPLRALCLLLGVVLLASPEIRQVADGLDLWVLADRSSSASAQLEPVLGEWLGLLEKSRGRNDRLHVVDFAAEALLRSEGDGTSLFPGDKNATCLAGAIFHTLPRLATGREGRLLVFTDGNSTEPLSGLAERLVRESVALDYRLTPNDMEGDWRIQDFSTSVRVREGEAFLLQLALRGPDEKTAMVEIRRDGQLIGRNEVAAVAGEAQLRFTDRLQGGGAHRYDVLLLAPGDPSLGNNTASAWVEVSGGTRALLVTAYANDPLTGLLRAQGTDVEVITNPDVLTIGKLSGAKFVILNNVPAYRLPPEFLGALPFFVTVQGGGLLMGGGRTSYAAGGYFGAPVADVLPVSMELRQEHRKLALAMVIALDRSGSMSASMPGTHLQKMDMANNAAATAIELLGDVDSVAVFAVDTSAHEMAPLSQVGAARERLVHAARRIQSAGGGIAVPTALKAAHNTLKTAQAGTRHVVVFADANDATQELGDYAGLIRSMRKDGITISIVGMGRKSDSGGAFLEEVARLGGGRAFFNENPGELTAMFAQETVAVARAAFVDKPVSLVPTPGWLGIAPRPLAWPDGVDGYNLCYLRPEATVAALSGDEYKAPLVAYWQRGAGRVAAVAFPLAGGFSEKVRAWPSYGDFAQTLTRWLEGNRLPPGAGLHCVVDGTQLRVDFRHDDSWQERVVKHVPSLFIANGVTGETCQVSWEKISPGHYRAMLALPAGGWLRGVVQAGSHSLPFGPVMATLNPEWTNNPARAAHLREIARVSGGGERLDLASAWQARAKATWISPHVGLLVAWLVLFLLEALQARTSWGIRAGKDAG